MKSSIILGDGAAKKLNELAREQMKTKLLNDILIDLTICSIEGWSSKDYLLSIQSLITDIIEKNNLLQS